MIWDLRSRSGSERLPACQAERSGGSFANSSPPPLALPGGESWAKGRGGRGPARGSQSARGDRGRPSLRWARPPPAARCPSSAGKAASGMGNCVKSPLRSLSRKKIHQEEKACYKAVQLSEEGPSASEGQGQGSLMVLAQNCAVMHNLLGPACIFLRKGFAENRQPV
uniref:Uncharacterized protein n=1 Tax=Laticauda laticaudata TaxID=8630 RepID=A0A8C5SVA0_LATLA